MDVSVIIVNYNTCRMTAECIDSVFAQTKDIAFEVILVDNGSTDESKDFFSNDPRITYIYNEENLGFGRANNIGVSSATGKYLFFLNSDTIVKNNALKIFIECADRLRESGIIGFFGTQCHDAEGRPNGYGGKFPTLWRSLLGALHLVPVKARRKEPFSMFSVDYVTGADLFVAKNVFLELGGFDESFFMYYEETDLQKRAKKLGYSSAIIYGPDIVHLEGRSSRHRTNNSKRMMAEKSQQQFLKKHNSSIRYKLYLCCYLCARSMTFFTGRYTIRENKDYFRLLLSNFCQFKTGIINSQR